MKGIPQLLFPLLPLKLKGEYTETPKESENTEYFYYYA